MDIANRPSRRSACIDRPHSALRRVRRGTALGLSESVLCVAAFGLILAAMSPSPLRALQAAETKARAAAAAPPAAERSEMPAAMPVDADRPAFRAEAGSQKSPADKKPAAAAARRLLREGYELRDQTGTFRAVGGRLVFALDKQPTRLVALENLNLERVARVLAENPAAAGWRISGVVSEYRGVNYVLIERAVLRGTAAEPPPAAPTAAPSPAAPAASSPGVKIQETASH